MTEANTKHGLSRQNGSKHPLYDTWHAMMTRCYDSDHNQYHRYGWRGITVRKRWHDPALFIEDIERLIGP